MNTRSAVLSDAEASRELLYQLDYPTAAEVIEQKLPVLLAHPDQSLLVYEKRGQIVGMISIYFIPQIALAGDFATISAAGFGWVIYALTNCGGFVEYK